MTNTGAAADKYSHNRGLQPLTRRVEAVHVLPDRKVGRAAFRLPVMLSLLLGQDRVAALQRSTA
jgi:hypothetical protein